jgi:hypothetical protein
MFLEVLTQPPVACIANLEPRKVLHDGSGFAAAPSGRNQTP